MLFSCWNRDKMAGNCCRQWCFIGVCKSLQHPLIEAEEQFASILQSRLAKIHPQKHSPHPSYFRLQILSLLFSLAARSSSSLAFSPNLCECTFLLLGLILYFSPHHTLRLEQLSRLFKIQLVYLAI